MSESTRLHVVDALRGFAIVSIMLLHNIEHFDFYYAAEGIPAWMVPIDKGIWDTMFFLFGGKSYAIFSLLFGLTFFIQSDNQERKGKDFRLRFAWRLLLLLGFGIKFRFIKLQIVLNDGQGVSIEKWPIVPV